MRLRLAVVIVALGALATPAGGATPPQGSWTTPHVRFEPSPGATLVVDDVGEFRGSVEIRRHGSGVAVINELPLDEYLLGLAEVPSNWPDAALEAQVIAARTFAVRSALVTSTAPHRVAGADICATQACQVYDGIDRERRDVGGRWTAAVRRTSNRFLLHDGFPILAKYSSSNGGFSEPGGFPYLPAVVDPDDAATSPWASWRSALSLADVAGAVPGDGRLLEVNRAADVVVLRREQTDGSIVDQGLSPTDFRRALNTHAPTPVGVPVPVPSTRFVAHTEGDVVVLQGGGYGHLVGMSQYGALGKALRGMGTDDILAAYYGGLRSVAIDPAQLPSTIRVAVALDHGAVTVRSTSGRFRVRAADGAPIAELVGGAWTATPAGDGLEVTGPARAARLRADRVSANVLRIAIDEVSRVVVEDGSRRDLGVLEPGVHDLAIADVPAVAVVADPGGGRLERVDVAVAAPEVALTQFRGAGAAAYVPPRQASAKTVPAIVASVAAASVLACGARVRRRA